MMMAPVMTMMMQKKTIWRVAGVVVVAVYVVFSVSCMQVCLVSELKLTTRTAYDEMEN